MAWRVNWNISLKGNQMAVFAQQNLTFLLEWMHNMYFVIGKFHNFKWNFMEIFFSKFVSKCERNETLCQ